MAIRNPFGKRRGRDLRQQEIANRQQSVAAVPSVDQAVTGQRLDLERAAPGGGGTAQEELLGLRQQGLTGQVPMTEEGINPELRAQKMADMERRLAVQGGATTATQDILATEQDVAVRGGALAAGATPGETVRAADPIPRDFGVGPPLKPDEPGVDPEARSRYERFRPGTGSGKTSIPTDFGDREIHTTTHDIHPDVSIPTFDPPDMLDPQSKAIWEKDNARIAELLNQFAANHITRTERANGTFGYDTLNDEARKALQGIQGEIENIQTRQKQLLSTFGPQGEGEKAIARAPDADVGEIGITPAEPGAPDTSGVLPENGGVTEQPIGEAPPLGEAGDIPESERELAEGVGAEASEQTPEQREFTEKVLETAKGGDIPAAIQESGVLDDVFEKLIEEMGGVSDEEKSTIRKKYEVATTKALSGLSGRGLGRGSEAIVAAVKGEIGATAEIATEEREARAQAVEAAKAAGELALESRGQSYDAYFKQQVVDIDRSVADQNYQLAIQDQNLAELKNAQGHSMDEAKLALEERLGLRSADLSDAQFQEAQRQFEADFGLRFDDQGFKQWLQTGELNLAVLDLQETTRLNEMRIANDFVISEAGLQLERDLGLAENELQRWIAGEKVDLERASQAIERWGRQMGFDLAEKEILVQLTAIEEGGPGTLQTLASIGMTIAKFGLLVSGNPGGAAAVQAAEEFV